MGSKLDIKVVQVKHQGKESDMKNEVNVNRTSKKESKKENFSPNLNLETEQDKKVNSQPKIISGENKVILEPQSEDCFFNSMIGFSIFPMEGEILFQVIEELGISNVSVKELSCWKFLLTFSSLEEKRFF